MSATLRKSSLTPPRGFHTQVPAPYVPVTCNRVEQTLSTPLYSARLIRQEKRKDSKDMQGYLPYGLIASVGALLNVRPYIQLLLAVNIGSLTNHSM